MPAFRGFPDVYGLQPSNIPKTRKDFWNESPERFERWWWGTQLMALSTDDDRPLDWLQAGRALQHAVLTATRYSMSAPYGRTARYRAPKRYGLPTRSFRTASPRTEARYGVAVSPLTQLFELQDVLGEARRWPRRWYHRWPWWYYPEVPQMVLRVGFVPVEPHLAPPLPATEFEDDRLGRRDGERPGRLQKLKGRGPAARAVRVRGESRLAAESVDEPGPVLDAPEPGLRWPRTGPGCRRRDGPVAGAGPGAWRRQYAVSGRVRGQAASRGTRMTSKPRASGWRLWPRVLRLVSACLA